MNFFSSKIIVLALCLLLGSATAYAEEILTNSSVEQLAAAGLSPDIITAKIKGTRSNFDVSIDQILALKKKGLPDEIIKAMVEAASNKNLAPQPDDQQYDQGSYSDTNQPQRTMDPNAKLLKDIKEAAELKEKRNYTWKTKAHAIAVTLKTIYPSNTHNIKYWWAYTQYSVLVEKETHILKGIKKVLYFDAKHEDALILKGDTYFVQAKDMRPDDDGSGFSQDDMADDAKKAYRTALENAKISAAKKSKIYYQLGEMAKEIDQNRTRADNYWHKALDAEPQGNWGLLAANRLGIAPPQE